MSNKPVKHGIYAWLESARIAPSIRGYRRIRKYLRRVQEDLIQSLGGNERVTIQQRLLIDSAVRVLGVILLTWAFIERGGPMRPDSLEKGVLEFQPAVSKELLTASNVLRQNLLALGLEPKTTDEIWDLRHYLELKAKEKNAEFRDERPSGPQPRDDKASESSQKQGGPGGGPGQAGPFQNGEGEKND